MTQWEKSSPPVSWPMGRRDDVFDEGGGDAFEGGADDDADGEVDDIAAQDKLFEFFDHAAHI